MAVFCLGLLLSVSPAAAFEPVDDFETYDTGPIAEATGGVWDGSGTSNVIAEEDGGRFLNYGTSSTAFRDLGDQSLTDGATGTYFFRLRRNTEAVDNSIGFTNAEAPTGFGVYQAQARVIGSGLSVRNGDGFDNGLADVDVGVWNNVWMVVDMASGTWDLYFSQEFDDAALIQEDIGFRAAGDSLLTMYGIAAGGAGEEAISIDDVYFSLGEDTSNPVLDLGGPPAVQFPLAADFGSVRFVDIRDDIGLGEVEIGVAEEGALPFTDDEEITITSLPSALAGKVALRTANFQATWEFDEPVTIEWTYTDAIPDLDPDGNPSEGANTTLADGSGDFQPLLGVLGAADEWVVREGSDEGNRFGNEDDRVLQAFGPDGSGGPADAPELKTTIRDLEAGKVYPVTAMFWHDPSPWGLRAGLEYGNDMHENELFLPDHPAALDTRTFAWTNEGVLTAQGNRLMKAAFLGHIAANDDGEIDVFVHDRPTDNQAERTWYDGVAVGSDIFKESGTYLAFEVDRDTTMYVINDPASEPTWLTSTFSSTGMTVGTTAGTFDVWERAVAARELVVLPGNDGDISDMNYWVVLDEAPNAITERPVALFQSLPSADWSTGRFSRQANSGADDELHTASLLAQVSNFNPESGFRLTSTVRVPRLQDEGDNSIGLLLLGGSETEAPIRAEWLPRASGGESILRFVDTSDESTLAQEPWTGLVPTATDNDVGASEGASEILYSAGTPVFVEDAESVVFSEDFEAGGEGWTIGADDPAIDDWEIGEPTSGPNEAFDGDNVAATNLDGVYSANTGDENPNIIKVAWLRSPVIDLREIADATLRFQEYMDVDTTEFDGDIFHFGTVTVLDADTLDEIEELAMYNTQILSWTERELDLSNVTGNRIILEFGLNTDEEEGEVGDGWYIDAVEITETGFEIVSLPENLAPDGTLYGIPTERAAVDDTSENHLQFTVTDRGASGNDGVTVYVAWDVRASGLEPDWLTQDFDRTDHIVGVSSDAGFHRLWAREYADGAQVTLGGASAAGTGATGLPFGTHNYFVLLGDTRPGLESFYTLEATGEWTGDEGTLTFTLTDANGASDSVQTMVSGTFEDRNQFGMAARHPDAAGGTVEQAPIWEVFSLSMDFFEAPDQLTFDQWRNSNFTSDQIDAGLADPEASPAGDGIANIIKYALGLPPLEPAAAADLVSIESDQDSPLTLVYQERTDIDRNEVEYIPQVSEDLIVWLEGEPNVVEISRVAGDSPNTEEVRVRGEVSQDALKAFLRLMIRMVE